MNGEAAREQGRVCVPGTESDNTQIDPEFKGWMLPLSPAELAGLQRRLDREGCRDALIIWKGHNILVDGHNRLEYCRAKGYHFTVIEMELADREVVKDYIEEIQRAQRNLSDLAVAYFRGKRYLEMKCQGKRTDLTSGQSDQKTTAEELEQECLASEVTIRRAARFFRAVEEVAGNCGVEARNLILARDTRLTHKYVLDLSDLSPKKQRKAIEELKKGKKPRKARDGEPKTMTVPMQPHTLAETLLKKLDGEVIAALIKALIAGHGTPGDGETQEQDGQRGAKREALTVQ